MPDLQSLHLETLDISIGTISASRVGFIQHAALRHLCERNTRVAAALWRETLVYASVFREWMTNIGQRDALSRAAHLMGEDVVRMRTMGLAEDHSCQIPMTQDDLGMPWDLDRSRQPSAPGTASARPNQARERELDGSRLGAAQSSRRLRSGLPSLATCRTSDCVAFTRAHSIRRTIGLHIGYWPVSERGGVA
jgi:hypothetical protein